MRKWIFSLVAPAAAVTLTAGVVWSGSLPSQAAAADNIVQITFYAFEPAEITVPVGGTVTWRNTDDAIHTAKARDGSFDTGYLPGGSEAQVTFPTAGDFGYFCELHPEKTGTVHVQ